jgi:hypothetical protein
MVAAKEHPPLVVEKDPAGEMAGLHPCEVAAAEDVPGRVVQQEEEQRCGIAAECTGLEVTRCRERVADVVVLGGAEISDARIVGARQGGIGASREAGRLGVRAGEPGPGGGSIGNAGDPGRQQGATIQALVVCVPMTPLATCPVIAMTGAWSSLAP